MKQNEAVARWHSADFLQAIQPSIESVFGTRQNSGPLDLSGITVGASASVPYLADKDFRAARLIGVDLSHAHISAAFDNCVLAQARLAGATLMGCTLTLSRFIECVFDGAVLNIRCNEARFERCSFADTQVTSEPVAACNGGNYTVFRSCNLAGAVFKGIELAGARFIDCDFTSARFEHCDLRDTKFYVNVPDLPQFVRCNLRGSRFAYEAPESE